MKNLIIISAALLLTSCFKFVPLNASQAVEAQSPEALVSQLELGKEYLFGLGDGSRIEMKVNRIENDSIFGVKYGARNRNLSVQIRNIVSIKRKKLAVGNTAVVTVVTLAVTGAIIVIANPVHISMQGWR
jgi:hypothetical protein